MGKEAVAAAAAPPSPRDEISVLLRILDTDGDCKISKADIEAVVRQQGSRWAKLRAYRIMHHADLNRDKLIKSHAELNKLLAYIKRKYPLLLDDVSPHGH
ncbi:EF-hand domain [Macleaya cordata]|uniref:EF-hand domain n=1 Tax=Macleaya cordata TaxID=56857 RepID=A0A200QIY6_MACCD|nr:EF-hand domain [Macleaya cordata]